MKYLKKNYMLFAAPLATMLAVLYIYYKGGFYPFGKYSFAYLDMYQQYVPLLYNIHAIFSDYVSLLFAANTGGGMNFFGVLNYYLSPDSFLCLLFKEDNLVYFVNILLMLKMTAAAFTAALALKYIFKDLSAAAAAALGIMYGFCGYVMVMYQIIAMLNGLIMFPLVMLAMIRLLEHKKSRFFIFCLTLSFYMNFYVALFILGFGFFFSAAYIYFLAPDKKASASLILSSAAISLGFSAVALLPCILSITSSVRDSSIFYNVLSGNPFGTGTYGFGQVETKAVYIICNAFALPCLVYFLFNLKKYGKTGIFLLVCAVLSFIPVIFEPVNVIWHMGSYAVFPLRYGFVQCFLLLMICAKTLEGANFKMVLKPLSLTGMALCACVCAIIVFTYLNTYIDFKGEIVNSSYNFEFSKAAILNLLKVSLIISAAYTVVLGALKFKLLNLNTAAILLAVIFIFEGISNFSAMIGSKRADNTEFAARTDLRQEIEKLSGDSSFFRVKDYNITDKINSSLISGNTFNHYTSLTNNYAAEALQKMGYTKAWFWISGVGGTALSDALLSQRYVVSKQSINNTYLEGAGRTDTFKIYSNPYSLGMGIITEGDLSKDASLVYYNPMDAQEKIYGKFAGGTLLNYYDYEEYDKLYISEENGVTSYKKTSSQNAGKLLYNIEVTSPETLYFYCDTSDWYGISFYINGTRITAQYPNYDVNGIFELGTFENSLVVAEVYFTSNVSAKSLAVAGIPLQKIQDLGSTLSYADSFEAVNNGYRIKANSQGEKWMFISVPYDSGFKCYINGKRTEIFKVFDGFMAVKLVSGKNDIRLSYTSPGLLAGIIVTLLTAALVLVWKNLKKRKVVILEITNRVETALSRLYLLGIVCAAAVMYAFPLIAFLIKL